MAGAGDRSLLRLITLSQYADRLTWSDVGSVNSDAVLHLSDEDPNTSFWDEGVEKETLEDVLLSLALERPRIAKMDFASLWQYELPADIADRIHQKDATGPYVDGRHLHYELHDPKESDYPEIVLKIAQRNDFARRTVMQAKDLIEDALFAGKFENSQLTGTLHDNVEEMLARRFVTAEQLQGMGQARPPIIYVGSSENPPRILGAIRIDKVQIEARKMIPGYGKSHQSVLYCDDGSGSRTLAQFLRHNGCDNVQTLKGGFAAWSAAGFVASEW